MDAQAAVEPDGDLRLSVLAGGRQRPHPAHDRRGLVGELLDGLGVEPADVVLEHAAHRRLGLGGHELVERRDHVEHPERVPGALAPARGVQPHPARPAGLAQERRVGEGDGVQHAAAGAAGAVEVGRAALEVDRALVVALGRLRPEAEARGVRGGGRLDASEGHARAHENPIGRNPAKVECRPRHSGFRPFRFRPVEDPFQCQNTTLHFGSESRCPLPPRSGNGDSAPQPIRAAGTSWQGAPGTGRR